MRLFSAWSWPRTILTSLLVVLFLLYAALHGRYFDTLEHRAYDQLLKWTAAERDERDERDERIILVDIDEKSLAAFGPWPWPRETVAQLITELTHHYQVTALGVDVVFPDAKPNDALLKTALNQPNVVFGQVLDFSDASQNHVGKLADLMGLPHAHFPTRIKGFIANHPEVLGANSRVGHISPVIDEDGKVRRIYPIACAQEGCTATLSLKLYQVLTRASALHAQMDGHALAVKMGEGEAFRLPLDREGAMIIPYRAKVGSFAYLSASDVLQHQVAPERLKNMIVVLGSTAFGLGDYVATPISSVMPALEIHGELVSAMLDRSFITPKYTLNWVMLPILLIAFFYLFWPWHSLNGILIWTILTLTVALTASVMMFVAYSCLIPLTTPFSMAFMLGLLGFILESLRLNQKLLMVFRQFNRFIPRSLVDRFIYGQSVTNGSQELRLTVLVVDMRGFTSAAEDRTSDQVAQLAQHCLKALTDAVVQHGGTIEKYSGDGLMAVWGAPPHRDSHQAQHAVAAGLAMQQAITDLAPWFITHNFEPMQASVGINTGEMSVGVFGSDEYAAWTVHGDAVNVASRIEQLTREVHENLLMGEQTARLFGMRNVRYCGEHVVKGRQGLVRVYTTI